MFKNYYRVMQEKSDYQYVLEPTSTIHAGEYRIALHPDDIDTIVPLGLHEDITGGEEEISMDLSLEFNDAP